MSEKALKNVSTFIHEYKEAVRHVWNLYFSANASSESLIHFEKIEIELFREIVASPLNLEIKADEFRQKPICGIYVRIKSFYTEFPVSFGSLQGNGNVSWGNEEILPVHNDQRLKFFDFFEWNHYGFVDYPLVRLYVDRLPQKPEQAGTFGLIESRFVDFFV